MSHRWIGGCWTEESLFAVSSVSTNDGEALSVNTTIAAFLIGLKKNIGLGMRFSNIAKV
jgi:hypothetical protein